MGQVNRCTCIWRIRWMVLVALLLVLVLPLIGLVEARGIPSFDRRRSSFPRSCDGLRLQDNHIVRGVPCEAACDHCGCAGKNLGEKCICFCAAEDNDKTECLSMIRKEELRVGIDNDILILTPKGARFARDIRQLASLRARMGRGAHVSWKRNENTRQVLVGKKDKINEQQ